MSDSTRMVPADLVGAFAGLLEEKVADLEAAIDSVVEQVDAANDALGALMTTARRMRLEAAKARPKTEEE